MTADRFLFTDRDNLHAPLRSNGRRGWYHPARTGGTDAIRIIAIHTAETDPSPGSAWNVARWQATAATSPSSYHVLVDSDHTVRTLEDTATAFHIASFNTPTLGLSFATRASWWGRYPVWDRLAVARAAVQARAWVDTYNIPLRWLTRSEALGGARGFVRHSIADPSRRTDPGTGFPAARFFELIMDVEDDVALTDEDAERVAEAVARKLGWVDPDRGVPRSYQGDVSRLRTTVREIARRVGVPDGDIRA